METIATYDEVRFDGRRTFTLLPDRILIRGRQTLQSEFETGIPLTTLDPNPDKLWVRHRSFIAGMVLAVVGFMGCTILVSGFHMSFTEFAPGMLAGVGASGVMLMLATYRKVEFIRFKNDAGIVLLDVARSGKNAAEFDSFVDAIIRQIRFTRGAA
jgi:hypothetical protein